MSITINLFWSLAVAAGLVIFGHFAGESAEKKRREEKKEKSRTEDPCSYNELYFIVNRAINGARLISFTDPDSKKRKIAEKDYFGLRSGLEDANYKYWHLGNERDNPEPVSLARIIELIQAWETASPEEKKAIYNWYEMIT